MTFFRFVLLSSVSSSLRAQLPPRRLPHRHTHTHTHPHASLRPVPLSKGLKLYKFVEHILAMAGDIGEGIAAGTQDLSALAGILCTDGVEQNVLALHNGYGTVCISAFSLLGILGLVRTSVKLALGREGCNTAGFGVVNMRPLYGYDAADLGTAGIVDCDWVHVVFGGGGVMVRKQKRYLSSTQTPMISVGSEVSGGLHGKTAVNIGNFERERRLGQSPLLRFAFAFLCPGFTCWILMVITSIRWDWTFAFAVPVFHACLVGMLAIPLWYQWQTDRPGHLATADQWNLLGGDISSMKLGSNTGKSKGQKLTLNLLQARVNDGDVLHFQGSITFLESWWLKGFAAVASAVTAVSYLCQYAILQYASSREAWTWLICQAVAAFIRILYWSVDPSFDDPRTENAEFVVMNNSTSECITLTEVICACGSGENNIPAWLYRYLTEQATFKQLMLDALQNTRDGLIPRVGAQLVEIDFDRILRHRISMSHLPDSAAMHTGVEGQLCTSPWRLTFWRDIEGDVLAVIVVNSVYHHRITPPTSGPRKVKIYHLNEGDVVEGDAGGQEFIQKQCWIHANHERVHNTSEGLRLNDPCMVYAVTAYEPETHRLHIQASRDDAICSIKCPIDRPTNDFESKATAELLATNGKSVMGTLTSITPLIQRYGELKHDADVLVTNSGPLFTRNGQVVYPTTSIMTTDSFASKPFNTGGQLNFRVSGLAAGRAAVRRYLDSGSPVGRVQELNLEKTVPRFLLPFAQADLALASLWHRLLRSERKLWQERGKDEEAVVEEKKVEIETIDG